MEINFDALVALLARTPAALDALLRGLPEPWTRQNEGGESWSVFDVLGHLIHGERTDWIPRARIILESGESRPFDPFDRFAQFRDSGGEVEDLLGEFARARADSLRDLRALNLQSADLERRGLHPALGVVTLGELLKAWGAHDLTHLHQISRLMAHQIGAGVGPWKDYMGVLKCDGHSD